MFLVLGILYCNINNFIKKKMTTILTFILCSQLHQVCMPPIQGGFYPNYYTCLEQGYKKSHNIIKELGLEDVEKNKYYIKFTCIKQGDPI